jgi:hypothetical protein
MWPLVLYLIISITGNIGQSHGRSPESTPIGYFIRTWSVLPLHSPCSELDSGHGLEDIYRHVIRTAQSQYRCFLSCRDAFPPCETKDELTKAVWKEACAREGRPDLSCQAEEAGLIFCSTWHGFTRIFSSYVAA